MTAKQLIDILRKYPADTPLITSSDNFELNGARVDMRTPYEVKVKHVSRQFRDAFDGESYSKEVYETVIDKTKEGVTALQFYA